MLADAPPVCFVATKDAKRARDFYGGVLGLRLVSEDSSALVFHAGPTTLRVQKVPEFKPQPFTVVGWVVRDVAGTAATLRAKGVVFLRFPWMDREVWTAPGGALVAWFEDPDGNMLSLTQSP